MRKISASEWQNILHGKDQSFINDVGFIVFKECVFEEIESSYNDVILDRRVEFIDCHFNNDLDLWYYDFKKSLVFQNCVFKGTLDMTEFKAGRSFTIDNCVLLKGIRLTDCEMHHASIYESRIEGTFWIRNGKTVGTLFIGAHTSRSSIENITIDVDVNSDLKLEIRNVDLEKLALIGYLSNGEIVWSNLRSSIVHIANFDNRSRLKLYNIQAPSATDSYCVIDRTNLGNAEFFRVDFASFEKFSIKDSYLLDCVFVCNEWQFPVFCESLGELKKSERDESPPRQKILQQIENYRQLKHAMNKSGNYLEERTFYMHEMNAYNSTLSWAKNFWSKIIIGFSYHLSRYGQSFSRPLIGLLLFHLLFFSLMNFVDQSQTTSGVHFQLNYTAFYSSLNEYFKTLNPARKFDDSLLWLSTLLDIVDRVIVSALLYNLIRATRRFVK